MEQIPHYVKHTRARHISNDYKCVECGSKKLKLKENKKGKFLKCLSCGATMPVVG